MTVICCVINWSTGLTDWVDSEISFACMCFLDSLLNHISNMIGSKLTWPCHSSSLNSKYSRKRSIEARVMPWLMVLFLSSSKHSHLLPSMVHSGKEWCASIRLTVDQIRLWRQNLAHFHHVPEIGRVISPLSCFLLLVCLLVRNSSFYPPFSSGSHNDWCQVHHNLERSSRLKRFRLTDYVFSNQPQCSFGFRVTNLYCSAISSSHKN